MASDEDITQIDIYDEILGIPQESDDKDIKRAYKKKALTCHPDKHPDDPHAPERFKRLHRALEILLDPKARANYDTILRCRKLRAARFKELDKETGTKRRKLEEKEKRATFGDAEKEAQVLLNQHIGRIRREGSKLLEEENLRLERQFYEERKKQSEKTNQRTSTFDTSPVTSHQKRRLQSQIYGHSNITHRQVSGTTNQSKHDASLSDEEYEKLVLTRLRQAQQLKSLSLND